MLGGVEPSSLRTLEMSERCSSASMIEKKRGRPAASGGAAGARAQRWKVPTKRRRGGRRPAAAPLGHLARRFVGEGHGGDLVRRRRAALDEVRDPVGQDAGSCRSRRPHTAAALRRGSPPHAAAREVVEQIGMGWSCTQARGPDSVATAHTDAAGYST